MSYNGSGTFVINSAGTPYVSGTVISSTAANALNADLATGLTTCLTKDGQTTPTANIPLGGFKITNLGAGTVASDAARLSQVQNSTTTTLITAAGTDTITGTVTPTLTAYTAGQVFSFVVAATNTGAVTLNVDSIGAKAVTRTGAVALVAGDMVTGQVAVVEYDGTRFQLINGNSFTNLKVSGTLGVTGITTVAAGSAAAPSIVSTTGTADTGQWFPAADTIAYSTAGSERVRFDSSGNVGIGTTAPLSQLDVAVAITSSTSGEATGVGSIRITNGAAALTSVGGLEFKNAGDSNGYGAKIQCLNSGGAQLVFANRNASATWTERMRISSGGNVGIACTPARRLSVQYDFAKTDTTSRAIAVFKSNDASNANEMLISSTGAATQASRVWNIQTGEDGVSNAGVMALQADGGSVGIGNSAVAAKLHVQSAGSTSATKGIQINNSSVTELFAIQSDGSFYTGAAASSPYNSTTGSAANAFIASSGQLQRSTSSLKYKTDVHDATHGLTEVLQLRPVTYKGKNDGDIVFGGFIAEEIHAIGLTEFVQYAEDETPDALAYGNMVSLLAKAIQEQQAIIETLTARITALETI